MQNSLDTKSTTNLWTHSGISEHDSRNFCWTLKKNQMRSLVSNMMHNYTKLWSTQKTLVWQGTHDKEQHSLIRNSSKSVERIEIGWNCQNLDGKKRKSGLEEQSSVECTKVLWRHESRKINSWKSGNERTKISWTKESLHREAHKSGEKWKSKQDCTNVWT